MEEEVKTDAEASNEPAPEVVTEPEAVAEVPTTPEVNG